MPGFVVCKEAADGQKDRAVGPVGQEGSFCFPRGL